MVVNGYCTIINGYYITVTVYQWLLMVMNNGYKWCNANLMRFKSGTLW